MAKTIVVCGATGGLGGSVARRLLEEGWHVRGITRNKESDSAKALSEKGVEFTVANYDEVGSLKEAFQGAHAIFGITNMFEYILQDGANEAAEREKNQLLNIAKAAQEIDTLEHLILHTLPAGEKLSGIYCPHLDGKAQAAEIIKETLPDVAKKTTFLWVGFFASNFWSNPMIKAFEVPSSGGSHILPLPANPDMVNYKAGDTDVNTGIMVSAILAKPELSLPAKIVWLYTEKTTFRDYINDWAEVTGRRTTVVQVKPEEYEQLWGPMGTELVLMFTCLEPSQVWEEPYQPDVLEPKDFGVEGELVGNREALEKRKDIL